MSSTRKQAFGTGGRDGFCKGYQNGSGRRRIRQNRAGKCARHSSAYETVLGSGAVTVFNQQRDVIDIMYRNTEFLAEESCGRCTPCRMDLKPCLKSLEAVQGRRSSGGYRSTGGFVEGNVRLCVVRARSDNSPAGSGHSEVFPEGIRNTHRAVCIFKDSQRSRIGPGAGVIPMPTKTVHKPSLTRYSCPYCPEIFDTYEKIKSHMLCNHRTDPLPEPEGTIHVTITARNTNIRSNRIGRSTISFTTYLV